jgi:hypothetical protein
VLNKIWLSAYSRIAGNRYVSNPLEIVKLHQHVKGKIVLEVDIAAKKDFS